LSQFRQSLQTPDIHSSDNSKLPIATRRMRLLSSIGVGAVFALCAFGCEHLSESPVDPSYNPPVLLKAASSISAVNTDTINIGTTRKPDDVLPISLTVTAQVSSDVAHPASIIQMMIVGPDGNGPLAAATLLDDGSVGDQVKGDGIYSAKTTFKIQRFEIGVFTAEVVAVGVNGYRSNTLFLPVTIFRGNHAPFASIIEAADTIRLQNDSQLLNLRVRVTDEDGLPDISKVIFNSYRPDGSASSGNPFQMFDDGSASHGDEKAGDGIFSLVVTLPPTTQPGTYRFEFQAFDRSNASSTVLVHKITVKP
jgi:hypothetical protein